MRKNTKLSRPFVERGTVGPLIKINMNSFLYNGTADEKKALNDFCDKWLQDSFWPYKEFELSLKIPSTFLLYSKNSEGITGLSLGRVMGEVSELFFIFTRPDLRGLGLAKSQLSDFEAHSLNRWQAEKILLEVRPTNVSAIKLYEALQYKRVGIRKRYYSDGEDALIFEKAIDLLQEEVES